MADSGSISLADRLVRIEGKQDDLLKAITELHVQVAILKAKAAFYGGAAGLFLGAVVPLVLQKLM